MPALSLSLIVMRPGGNDTMVAATVKANGEVTIPKVILESLGVSGGGQLRFVTAPDGRILLEAEAVDIRSLRGVLKHRGPPVSVEQMNEAIARGSER
ncbi:MAG: AbrB/MazE/SpoVT family DNA-binding domain-containing protein [Myxococcota bacterium]